MEVSGAFLRPTRHRIAISLLRIAAPSPRPRNIASRLWMEGGLIARRFSIATKETHMTSDPIFGGGEAPTQRRLRYPAIVELIILGGLTLILMIGLLLIGALVSERRQRAESVRNEIASSWGQSQTIGGP